MHPDLAEKLDHGSVTILIPIVEQAALKQQWKIVGSCEAKAASGYVQHGVAFILRHNPVFEDRPYATVGWARREDGEILFHEGHYDLTREDAVKDYIERIGRLPS